MADLPDFAEARERSERALDLLREENVALGCVYEPHQSTRAALIAGIGAILALHAAWEAATAERDAARRDLSTERAIHEETRRRYAIRRKRGESAEAERDRLAGHVTALREALERIVSSEPVRDDQNLGGTPSRACSIAREVLAGLEEPPQRRTIDEALPGDYGLLDEGAPVPGAGGEHP